MGETLKTIVIGSELGSAGEPIMPTSREILLGDLDQSAYRVLRQDEIIPHEDHQYFSQNAITGETLVPVRLFGP